MSSIWDRFAITLWTLCHQFGVTLPLFLTCEGDSGLLEELFARTVGHVGDKNAIWEDFGRPLEEQNGSGEPATGVECGPSVDRVWTECGPSSGHPAMLVLSVAPRAPISLKKR